MLVDTTRQMFYGMKSCAPHQGDLLVHPSERKEKILPSSHEVSGLDCANPQIRHHLSGDPDYC